jgi:hypothetical protein
MASDRLLAVVVLSVALFVLALAVLADRDSALGIVLVGLAVVLAGTALAHTLMRALGDSSSGSAPSA